MQALSPELKQTIYMWLVCKRSIGGLFEFTETQIKRPLKEEEKIAMIKFNRNLALSNNHFECQVPNCDNCQVLWKPSLRYPLMKRNGKESL